MRWPHRKIKSIKCLIDNVKVSHHSDTDARNTTFLGFYVIGASPRFMFLLIFSINLTLFPYKYWLQELGLTNEIEMLEEHKRKLEQLPEMELTERTKKLRQACFKANYKKRRSMQASFAWPNLLFIFCMLKPRKVFDRSKSHLVLHLIKDFSMIQMKESLYLLPKNVLCIS